MAPIAVAKMFVETSRLKHRITAIQRAEASTKPKYVRMLDNISLSSVKQISKHHGTTFNVIVQSLLSQTLKEYCMNQGDSKTDAITFTSTFSLK